MRHLNKFHAFLNENNSSLIDEILLLDEELEKTPLYKQYERELVEQMIEPQIDKQLDMIAKMMGVDISDIPFDRDEMRKKIADMTYQQAAAAIGSVKKDEETFREKRGTIIPMVDKIIKLAERDQEFRLCAKLKKFNDLLNQL